jgi:hypothetical protein
MDACCITGVLENAALAQEINCVSVGNLHPDLGAIHISSILNQCWAFAGAKVADFMDKALDENDPLYPIVLREFMAKLNNGTSYVHSVLADLGKQRSMQMRLDNDSLLEAVLETVANSQLLDC